jgi:fatty-acyl-CoA synthase
MAAVIARPGATVTEAELIEFCRDRLPGFKAPKRIHFRNSLPISAANKILKRDADGYLPPRGGRVRNPRSFLP